MKYLESLAVGFIITMILVSIILIGVCFVGLLMVMKPIGWVFLGLFVVSALVIGTVVYLIDHPRI